MAGPSAPPPAWYPDPGGRHEFRWWDGARWTEHVSNRRIIGRDPLPVRPPSGGGSPSSAASGPPRGGPAQANLTAGTPEPARTASGPVSGAAPAPLPGPGAGPGPGEELRFEPGAWLEAFSVFVRRGAGMERGLSMSFDVRDAGGTALLSVVSVPALNTATTSRRRPASPGSDLLLVTPADVAVARLARAGPGDQFVLLLPGGGVLGWAAVAPDADPLTGGGLGVGLTVGTEATAPPWARLATSGGEDGAGEITTTTGLLVATMTTEVGEPANKRAPAPREHRLSYRSDVNPIERLLTVTALIALDLARSRPG